MAVGPSLTFYIQVSSFFMYIAGTEFSSYDMLDLPEMQSSPQMLALPPVPTKLDEYEDYEEPHQERHKHKKHKHKHSKHKHESVAQQLLVNHENSNDIDYTEVHSEESRNFQKCTFESCERCTSSPPESCQSFCQSCFMYQMFMNREIMYYPYPYFVNVSQSSTTPETEKKEGQDKNKTKVLSSDNQTTEKVTKTTENITTKPVQAESKTTTIRTKLDLRKGKTTEIMDQQALIENTDKAKFSIKSPYEDKTTNLLRLLVDAIRAQGKNLDNMVFEIPGENNKYMLMSLREVQQEDWYPKYGIMHIPDRMASDLLLNWRATKVLQSGKEFDTVKVHRNINPGTLINTENQTNKKELPIEIIKAIYGINRYG